MAHKHNQRCKHDLQELFAKRLKTRPADKALAKLTKAVNEYEQAEEKS